jgi:hypothetical protein
VEVLVLTGLSDLDTFLDPGRAKRVVDRAITNDPDRRTAGSLRPHRT